MTASTAQLSWHEPKDNGSPILGYWIERKEVNSKHWTRVNRALINSLEVKVSNLMEGLTYIFRVCAENLAGPGPFSEPSDRTTAMDAICKYCAQSKEKKLILICTLVILYQSKTQTKPRSVSHGHF